MEDPEVTELLEAYDRIMAGEGSEADFALLDEDLPLVEVEGKQTKSYTTKEKEAAELFRDGEGDLAIDVMDYINKSKLTNKGMTKGLKRTGKKKLCENARDFGWRRDCS